MKRYLTSIELRLLRIYAWIIRKVKPNPHCCQQVYCSMWDRECYFNPSECNDCDLSCDLRDFTNR